VPNRSAITLLHIRGIRIGVDYSWFVVLFLVILWLSGFYDDVLGAKDGAVGPYALAVASALLFFTSILLHELGHAFVAIRKGIPIPEITLWMFGGIARMERDTDSPGTEFKIAIAGPAVTAVIAAICVVIGIALSGPADFRDAALTNGDTEASGVLAMVGWLAGINVLVLAFNLIPAFPLDGGRIARAIAWWRTGDRRSATRFAAALGEGFGLLMIMVGLGYFVIYLGDIIGGIWLALIGFILRGSAKGAVMQSELTRPLEGLSVGDVMDREPVAMPAELPVARALDEYFLRYGWPWFPVTDEGGRFQGLLERGQADAVPEVEREATAVSALLPADAAGHSDLLSVPEDSPLEAVVANQTLRNLGALAAVDADGRLRGVITADAIGRALRGADSPT
jgi:Zn-dependent protease